MLRHIVDQALAGADQKHLLALLGLADDPRNRASVNRYLRLAEPPVNAKDDEASTDSPGTPAPDA